MELPVYTLTKSGSELFNVCKAETDLQYVKEVAKLFRKIDTKSDYSIHKTIEIGDDVSTFKYDTTDLSGED